MSEHAVLPRCARRLTALLCLAFAAGCNAPSERQITYATWQQTEPLPQPEVERVPISHVIAFAPQSPRLSGVEREALLRFLHQADVRPGDAVVLAVTPPAPGQPDQTAARLAAVRNVLALRGIGASALPGGGVPGLSGDEILLTAQTLAVVAPDCPGYNAPIVLGFERKPKLNFGCANAANLGLMVANPADLVRGRPLPPADGEAATLSIQRYRAGKVYVPVRKSTN